MSTSEMMARLHASHESTEEAAENAIAIYQAAKAAQDEWQAVADAAKAMIQEIMVETERTSIVTPAGKAMITAPSMTIGYDSKALSALCASSAEVEALLSPHRKITERAGTLRITAAK